jgi:hypothetical protein
MMQTINVGQRTKRYQFYLMNKVTPTGHGFQIWKLLSTKGFDSDLPNHKGNVQARQIDNDT